MQNKKCILNNERDKRFDFLKGIAIFLVVTGHVIMFGINQHAWLNDFTYKLINKIHMPLFFFISGWFAYNSKSNNSKFYILKRRFRQLIIPALVLYVPWVLISRHSGIEGHEAFRSFTEYWLSNDKNGYWFPYVLFAITIIWIAIKPIFTMLDITRQIAIIITIFTITNIVYVYMPVTWCNLLCFPRMIPYIPIFLIGTIAGMHKLVFPKLFLKPISYSSALVGLSICLILLIYEPLPLSYSITAALQTISHIFIAILAFNLANPLKNIVLTESISNNIIKYFLILGKNSLGIYLLHYFFLFPIPPLTGFLESCNQAFVISIISASFIAFLIITVVFGCLYILSGAPSIAKLLTGQNPNFKYS